MSSALSFTLIPLLLLSCTNCSVLNKLKKKEPPPVVKTEPTKLQPQNVGSIGLVHPDYGFVLIQTTKGFSLPEGTVLTCYSASGVQTSQLKSTLARQGNYMTADITSGTPEKGNVVVYDPDGTMNPAPATAPTTVQPPATGTATSPPVGSGVSARPGAASPAAPVESLLPREALPAAEPGLRAVPTIQLGQ